MPGMEYGILKSTAGGVLADGTANQYATAAGGGAAVVTLVADATKAHVLHGFAFSTSADPTAGDLSIVSSGMTTRHYKITKSGPGVLTFPTPFICPAGISVVCQYDTGGGAGVPTLEVFSHKE